jgi:hypothetical protein
MLGNGKMTSSMEKELSLGITIKLNLLASFKKAKKQERVNLNLKEDFTMAISLMDSFMEQENTIFQRQERSMKVSL